MPRHRYQANGGTILSSEIRIRIVAIVNLEVEDHVETTLSSISPR